MRTSRCRAEGRHDDNVNLGYSPSSAHSIPVYVTWQLLHVTHTGARVRGEGEYPDTELPPSQTTAGLGSPAPPSGRDLRSDVTVHRKVAMPAQSFTYRMRWIASSLKRLLVVVAGFALLGAGLTMLVLPGPGILVIFIGLVVLATRYTWAERALERTRAKAADAAAQLQARRAARAGLAISAAALITGGAAAAVVVDGHRYLGIGALIAGIGALAVLIPATQHWINGAGSRSSEPESDNCPPERTSPTLPPKEPTS